MWRSQGSMSVLLSFLFLFGCDKKCRFSFDSGERVQTEGISGFDMAGQIAWEKEKPGVYFPLEGRSVPFEENGREIRLPPNVPQDVIFLGILFQKRVIVDPFGKYIIVLPRKETP